MLPLRLCCVAYSPRGIYSATVAVPPCVLATRPPPTESPPHPHPPLGRTPPHSQGIHWQEPDKLVAVSDKMKSGGKQPFTCMEHDQSIHTFLIPG